MIMELLQLIERNTFMLHPGMRFKGFRLSWNSDAYAGRNSLNTEQIPERQGLLKTARMGHGVVHGGTNHAAGLLHDLHTGDRLGRRWIATL